MGSLIPEGKEVMSKPCLKSSLSIRFMSSKDISLSDPASSNLEPWTELGLPGISGGGPDLGDPPVGVDLSAGPPPAPVLWGLIGDGRGERMSLLDCGRDWGPSMLSLGDSLCCGNNAEDDLGEDMVMNDPEMDTGTEEPCSLKGDLSYRLEDRDPPSNLGPAELVEVAGSL